MANIVEIIITHDETSANDQRDLYAETGYQELAGLKLVDFMKKVVSGSHPATVRTMIGAAKATGTITMESFVADDTITVGGVTFTGKASPSGAAQFLIGADDTATAAAAVVKINAHTTLDGLLVATSALGVITITAKESGEGGNLIGLAISAHGSVSGALCTGGSDGDTDTTHYFGSSS